MDVGLLCPVYNVTPNYQCPTVVKLAVGPENLYVLLSAGEQSNQKLSAVQQPLDCCCVQSPRPLLARA